MSASPETPAQPSMAAASAGRPAEGGLVLALCVLTLALVVLVIGAGLLYVAMRHPSLTGPLSVATGGVALIVALTGVLLPLFSAARR
ncbi:hypothetical protein [Streptomyces goshikiensis]|uniref:hypothetical protein n=1 Tax=Streptomyces goshikiensis TaxID=1942 RepID=UPI0036604B63